MKCYYHYHLLFCDSYCYPYILITVLTVYGNGKTDIWHIPTDGNDLLLVLGFQQPSPGQLVSADWSRGLQCAAAVFGTTSLFGGGMVSLLTVWGVYKPLQHSLPPPVIMRWWALINRTISASSVRHTLLWKLWKYWKLPNHKIPRYTFSTLHTRQGKVIYLYIHSWVSKSVFQAALISIVIIVT